MSYVEIEVRAKTVDLAVEARRCRISVSPTANSLR